MLELLEKLKDPLLVWKFQYYFGIRKLHGGMATESTASLNGGSHYRICNGYSGCLPSQPVSNNTDDDGENSSSSSARRRLKRKSDDDDCDTGSAAAEDIAPTPSTGSDSAGGGGVGGAAEQQQHRITRPFWYYLFCVGAALGDETFYSSFFPFWFWNVDGAVFRRVVMIWVLIMYIGQGLKDVIRWPRPSSPPVVRLEEKWALEYGMPSTHAMVGGAVPFSFLFYTMYRYEYPVILGVVICVVWCCLVCGSRLYLGMHTVLDIIGGLVLVVVLLLVLVPFIDGLDAFLLTSRASPPCVLVTAVAMMALYPDAGHWTPARGDTVTILGVGAGVAWGSWLNYQWGIIRGPPIPPPYRILWPTVEMAGHTLLRTCIGILVVVATRAVFRSLTYSVACHLLRLDPRDKVNHENVVVEPFSKFVTYSAVAFNITYFSPMVFRLLNIERVTMFTEV